MNSACAWMRVLDERRAILNKSRPVYTVDVMNLKDVVDVIKGIKNHGARSLHTAGLTRTVIRLDGWLDSA